MIPIRTTPPIIETTKATNATTIKMTNEKAKRNKEA